jgi:hypothetical protein
MDAASPSAALSDRCGSGSNYLSPVTGLFFIAALIVFFDPQNGLSLRRVLLVGMAAVWVYGLVAVWRHLTSRIFILLTCYSMPLMGLLVYVVRGYPDFELTDTSYISAAIVLSMVFLLDTPLRQKKMMIAVVAAGALFSIFLVVFAADFGFELGLNLYQFVVGNDIGRVAFRDFAGYSLPYIYLFSSPFLILPIAYLLSSKKALSSLWGVSLLSIMIAAFFLSGPRAHIFISVVMLAIFVAKITRPRVVVVAGLLASIIAIVAFPQVFSATGAILLQMFSPQEVNNSYKLSMLSAYAEIFNDPRTLLIGQGFEAIRWSEELRGIVAVSEDGVLASKSELTAFELIRVFGLPMALAFMVFMAVAITRQSMEYKKIALLMLLFISLLNPHLFSTYGALTLAVCLSPDKEGN